MAKQSIQTNKLQLVEEKGTRVPGRKPLEKLEKSDVLFELLSYSIFCCANNGHLDFSPVNIAGIMQLLLKGKKKKEGIQAVARAFVDGVFSKNQSIQRAVKQYLDIETPDQKFIFETLSGCLQELSILNFLEKPFRKFFEQLIPEAYSLSLDINIQGQYRLYLEEIAAGKIEVNFRQDILDGFSKFLTRKRTRKLSEFLRDEKTLIFLFCRLINESKVTDADRDLIFERFGLFDLEKRSIKALAGKRKEKPDQARKAIEEIMKKFRATEACEDICDFLWEAATGDKVNQG